MMGVLPQGWERRGKLSVALLYNWAAGSLIRGGDRSV